MSDFTTVDPGGWEYDLQSVCRQVERPEPLRPHHLYAGLFSLHVAFPITQHPLVRAPYQHSHRT